MLEEGRRERSASPTSAPTTSSGCSTATDVVPAINQVELHPYYTNATVQAADRTLGILTQAWSPIGGIHRYRPAGSDDADVLQNPVITDLAAKYGKTPAQVVLRWHLYEGRSALPKS